MKVSEAFHTTNQSHPTLKVLLAVILATSLILGKHFVAFADLIFLDPSFGANGIVTTDVSENNDTAYAVALQDDGKIIVAGFSSIVRYNNDGTLDSGFGSTGIVHTEVNENTVNVNAIVVQADNKIVVVGAGSNGTDNGFAIIRYNSDGTLDVDFGNGGLAFTPINTGHDQANAVALQSDGKIVVAGTTFSDGLYINDIAVVRYLTNGILDTTFGIDGISITDVDMNEDTGYAMVVQNDDKIVVAGQSSNSTNEDILVIRYSSEGYVDASFGDNGIVTTAIHTGHDVGRAVAMQDDGKIVVAGWCETGEYSHVMKRDFALVRYNNDGTLDASFDGDGLVTTAIGTIFDIGQAVAIQSDGKIIVAGESFNNDGTDYNFAAARFNSDGSLDTEFSNDGIITTDISSRNDKCYALAIQSDGRIILAGSANGEEKIAVIRYGSSDSYETYIPFVLTN
jgi:uncharacterized delta-60 repeat protein